MPWGVEARSEWTKCMHFHSWDLSTDSFKCSRMRPLSKKVERNRARRHPLVVDRIRENSQKGRLLPNRTQTRPGEAKFLESRGAFGANVAEPALRAGARSNSVSRCLNTQGHPLNSYSPIDKSLKNRHGRTHENTSYFSIYKCKRVLLLLPVLFEITRPCSKVWIAPKSVLTTELTTIKFNIVDIDNNRQVAKSSCIASDTVNVSHTTITFALVLRRISTGCTEYIPKFCYFILLEFFLKSVWYHLKKFYDVDDVSTTFVDLLVLCDMGDI